MIERKPRKRGAIYPYEILVRLTGSMGERLEVAFTEAKKENEDATKVDVVRAALDKYLPKKKKQEKAQ